MGLSPIPDLFSFSSKLFHQYQRIRGIAQYALYKFTIYLLTYYTSLTWWNNICYTCFPIYFPQTL